MVDEAIAAVLQQQSFTLMGTEVTLADLDQLRKLRQQLIAEKNMEDGALFSPVRFNACS